MDANGPTWREWTDLRVAHERELREANERSTALALELSRQSASRNFALIIALAMAIIGPIIGVVVTVLLT